MACQRTLNLVQELNLVEVTETTLQLLSKGFDWSTAITEKPEEEFVKSSGLSSGIAHVIFAKSREKSSGWRLLSSNGWHS